jgi:hypothetical protein
MYRLLTGSADAGILHMAEMIALCYEWNILLVISGLLLAADSVAILPLLLRGIRRWTV